MKLGDKAFGVDKGSAGHRAAECTAGRFSAARPLPVCPGGTCCRRTVAWRVSAVRRAGRGDMLSSWAARASPAQSAFDRGLSAHRIRGFPPSAACEAQRHCPWWWQAEPPPGGPPIQFPRR